MKLPKTFTETPNFDTPIFAVPGMGGIDSDRDGVIDPWDCQPFNPDADGLVGDIITGARERISSGISTVRTYVKPDYKRAAGRRQAVRQRVSGGARHVTRTIKQRVRQVRQIRPSASRAKERRAAVMGKVQGVRKKLHEVRTFVAPPSRVTPSGKIQPFAGYTPEAAAGRRATIAKKLGINLNLGIDFGRAKERRATVRETVATGLTLSPPRIADILKPLPQQRQMARHGRDTQRPRKRNTEFPEPDLSYP